MSRDALGLIETVGLAAAIEAADTCMKSANVELIGYELTKGDGMVTVKIKGDVSAVKAAIESAKVSAAAVNTVYATLIIPRPVDKLDIMIESSNTIGVKNKIKEKNETIEIIKVEMVNEGEVCNLCYDPKCTRKKGMTRKLCIHYKDSEGDKK
ncbi:BMC domain-containing protein [Clostridium estertheticum]|uniref:BMC domain-containing protein n=1 Tax=Clostridium estertheticum TaxID=238834 RepID=UPI001C6E20CB|nr:BMC domain-containing protein [Clostridium estertheticum]MBW9154000.1 BMC domain-containing protein [Clostridium estertheticum]WLC83138.1 BMC domain-containing protein [Clostridium estertheticum]